MLAVLLKTIKTRRVSIVIFALVVLGYAMLIGGFYPSLAENAEDFSQFMEIYPDDFMAFFGGDIMEFTTFEGFISLEYYNFVWVFVIGGLAISIATAAVAQENEKGTLELMLWQPISRTKFLSAKVIALIFILAVMTLVTVLGTFASAASSDVVLNQGAYWTWAVVGFLFMLTFGGISFLLSVIFNERGKANLIAITFLIVSYLLNSLAEIIDKLKDFEFLSLFNYYNPLKILQTGEWPIQSIIVFVAVFIVSIALSIYIFNKKNIAV
ncbi:ABC transporter permease [Patescibacteria group bacterium]|nr:ABC transporter permease [Patescibacteria group bacterium]